ncbi:murein DD-endopeptidase MepM/ murein hydrolase activator NlpD [Bacillus mesophilus]|uniref:Peptidoglycan DD-metalloendopeptidase family protein n=1 Tax=Bacillus mesophilus TaxID=1808955 RepID=A0A6M0Q4W4_9BACI|nr:murein DD-endopeptidase MepM/ murein hydrolase activator NlpD [Bacillus mesophilus]NEY71273.1 peptidoglycan DD-metalloendopeptidase family protein [Bacillus mesophilus]
MLDLSRRLLIVLIMGFCIACMFLSVKTVKAEEQSPIILAETIDWVWPVYGELTDHFGTRGGHHHGIDIAAPTGTDTFSVEDGTVTKSYYSSSYGHVVFIKHPEGFETVYAHLSERLVEEGQEIKKGDVIGKVGNTGRSRGAHLHFEVHMGDWNVEKTNSINPLHALDVSVLIDGKVSQAMAEKKQAEKMAVLSNALPDQPADQWNISEKEAEQLLSTSVIVSSKDYSEDVLEIQGKQPNQEEVKASKKMDNIVVEVTKGMTLWGLSEKYDVSVKSIKEWNKLSSDTIVIGQELSIIQE